ncbi:MAG: type VI secretion system-associated FHA domain protein TagH [Burkholderiales bacterium]
MLTIKVLTYKDAPLEQAIVAQFDERGGTIGRSPESTLLLPDPERIISRTHVIVGCRDGRFHVKDQGTTVALVVNGKAPGRGQEHPLAHGDELRIAGYLLRVVGLDAPAGAHDEDDTTTILRQGTMLSWSEDGRAVPQNRIATIIVPSPENEEPLPATGAPPAPRAEPPVPPTNTPEQEDALLAALLRGAGVPDIAVPGGMTPALMREVGEVMRETMQGLLDLLAARAHAKREVRADATVIVAADNNPLKFSPGLEAALSHLLLPHGQGFMPPLRSLADARASLRTHQEGFVAGMRAALTAVLARFDPAKLEARLSESSSGSSFLPMNNKAKLWNMYEELYGQIAKEAETDFHFLFGEEFLRAYQAKTRPAGSAPSDTPG